MTNFQELNNQQLLQVIRERVRDNQIAESNISEAIAQGKQDHLKEIRAKILQDLEREEQEQDKLLAKEYQEWANDPNERADVTKEY